MSGSRDPRNLDRLFAWLRFRPCKQRVVKDVGDFAAHGDERDQGVAWKGAGHFAAMVLYHLRKPKGGLPHLKEAMRGALHLSPPAAVKKDTRIGKALAIRTLESAMAKILSIDGNNLITDDTITDLERKLLLTYSSRLVSRPVFNDRLLADEFAECLVRNSLIQRGQVPRVLSQRGFIAIFAVEKMHRSRLLFDGNIEIMLEAGATDGYINIHAAVAFPERGGHKVLFPLFTTECRAEDWCSPSIWPPGLSERLWPFPLELGADGKLIAIG